MTNISDKGAPILGTPQHFYKGIPFNPIIK